MPDESLLEKLEKNGNEQEVRTRLAKGQYHSELVPQVKEWLRRKEEERALSSATRAEARDEESLSISRRALRNSELATRIAIMAIILSIIMAIYEIIKLYLH